MLVSLEQAVMDQLVLPMLRKLMEPFVWLISIVLLEQFASTGYVLMLHQSDLASTILNALETADTKELVVVILLPRLINAFQTLTLTFSQPVVHNSTHSSIV